jgi:hypothetical protein
VPWYRLKPIGHTRPQPSSVGDSWVSERGLGDFALATGPADVHHALLGALPASPSVRTMQRAGGRPKPPPGRRP